jgi:hypothetical protein
MGIWWIFFLFCKHATEVVCVLALRAGDDASSHRDTSSSKETTLKNFTVAVSTWIRWKHADKPQRKAAQVHLFLSREVMIPARRRCAGHWWPARTALTSPSAAACSRSPAVPGTPECVSDKAPLSPRPDHVSKQPGTHHQGRLIYDSILAVLIELVKKLWIEVDEFTSPPFYPKEGKDLSRPLFFLVANPERPGSREASSWRLSCEICCNQFRCCLPHPWGVFPCLLIPYDRSITAAYTFGNKLISCPWKPPRCQSTVLSTWLVRTAEPTRPVR